MSKNIFQLWKDNGELLPFGARRETWAKTTHALVEEVVLRRWPYGTAYGNVFQKGIMRPPLDPSIPTSESGLPEISCAGCYQWSFVDLHGLPRGKPSHREKPTKVIRAGMEIGFGKHRSTIVEEVFRRDSAWIKWALQNVSHFAIEPKLIEEFNPSDPDLRIGAKLRAINYERVEKCRSTTGVMAKPAENDVQAALDETL